MVGVGPPKKKNVSLRGGGVDKKEGERRREGTSPPKKCQFGGVGVDLPECQERRWGKHNTEIQGGRRPFKSNLLSPNMPRRGWSPFESSDGGLTFSVDHGVRRTRRRLQTSCRSLALSSLGPEDSGARAELDAALTRQGTIETQASSFHESLKCARLGSPKVHISGPRRFKHHQNSTRRPPREGRMNEMRAGEGKKARNFGPHLRGPTLRGSTLRAPCF